MDEWSTHANFNRCSNATRFSHHDKTWGDQCLHIWIIPNGLEWLCCSLHRFFSTIELNILHFIILRCYRTWLWKSWIHLNQGAIYEPNTPRQFLQLHIEDNFLFRCWPMDFICKCIINSCALSCKTKFDEFHMKVSYIIKLSCFMYRMKLKKCCLGVNFDTLLETIGTSFVLIKYQKKTWNIKIGLKNLNPNFKTLSPNSKPLTLGWNFQNQS